MFQFKSQSQSLFSCPDRRCFLHILSVGVCSAVATKWSLAQGDGGASQLAQAVSNRPAGRDMTSLVRMELTERGRVPRVRELITYRLDRGDGETANLMRFLEPEDIAGTGLLGVTQADGHTEQWLFLPALDRVRRIAGDRKGGRFVGSDLFFEDLQERKPIQDRHQLLAPEAVAGVNCQVLESVPVQSANSVYQKRLSWIDPQTAMVMRVDYFERDDQRPGKRWLLGQRRKIQNIWTVTDSAMTDLGTGHETRLFVHKAVYDRKLPARLFSARSLGDEQLESDFRP
jgi:hypothetical protein